jgi:ADP-heptose:LPS heptosyltransferase
VKILLIRLRLVGDVVFTTPAVRAIRRALDPVHLSYLVEPAAAPVVQDNPHVDEVLVIGRPRGLGRLATDAAWAARLRRARFDAVVDFHGGPRAAWLTRATRAPIRIGYRTPGRLALSALYTRVVDRPRALRPRHSVENQWDLIRVLHPALDRPPDPALDATEMGESPAAAARVAARLAALGFDSRDRLVVMHVSAGNPFRRWPAEAFAALAVRLAAAGAFRRIILTAGPSDRAAAEAIAAAAASRLGGAGPRRVVALDDLDLAELRALIARAALFVGGDSGPLHVASTTRTAIVGIYGPTLAERSRPWRDPVLVSEAVDAGPLPCRPCAQRVCAPGDFRCLRWVSPDQVAAACERALGAASLAGSRP